MEIEKLLEIESNSKLYQFKLFNNDFLMWPLVRFSLLQSSINAHCEVRNPWIKRISFINKVKYYILSYIKNPLRISENKDILILGSDVSNIKIKDKYYNRLNEYFANCAKDKTVIIERSNFYSFRLPRSFSPVFFHDWILIKANIKNKFLSIFKFNSPKFTSEIDNFIFFLKENYNHKFENDKVWENIRLVLFKYNLIFNDLYESYSTILKRINPKLLLIEDACYGDYLSILIKSARDQGIYVCEYQHGLVSKNHPAYNFSSGIKKDYLHYLPHEYLSYGPYWEQNISLPIRIRNIGNPHLTESISSLKKSEMSFYIAYLSSGLSSEKNIQFLFELKKLLGKEKKIIFRPHPCELSNVHETYKDLESIGIVIDFDNLYSTITKSEFIVSEISTVVYEAMAFNKVIFIIESTYSRINSGTLKFNYVRSPLEVIESIQKQSYIIPSDRLIWSENWKENFLNLLSELKIIHL